MKETDELSSDLLSHTKSQNCEKGIPHPQFSEIPHFS